MWPKTHSQSWAFSKLLSYKARHKQILSIIRWNSYVVSWAPASPKGASLLLEQASSPTWTLSSTCTDSPIVDCQWLLNWGPKSVRHVFRCWHTQKWTAIALQLHQWCLWGQWGGGSSQSLLSLQGEMPEIWNYIDGEVMANGCTGCSWTWNKRKWKINEKFLWGKKTLEWTFLRTQNVRYWSFGNSSQIATTTEVLLTEWQV